MNCLQDLGRKWDRTYSSLQNEHYMMVVDYYSLWPEVYLLQKPSTDGLIEAVKDAFSRHGVAEQLISVNGCQYSSFKFKRFQKEW